MRKDTLSFKLIRGFLLILVPLAAFLFYNNYDAMRIVREEVSKSTSTALSLIVSEIDKSLQDTDYYLLRLATSDVPYSNLITLKRYPVDSGEYFLAKQALLNKMSDDLNSYKVVDTLFVYDALNDNLIPTQRSYETSLRNEKLVRLVMKQSEAAAIKDWVSISMDNRSYLVRLEKPETAPNISGVSRHSSIG